MSHTFSAMARFFRDLLIEAVDEYGREREKKNNKKMRMRLPDTYKGPCVLPTNLNVWRNNVQILVAIDPSAAPTLHYDIDIIIFR